MEDLLMAVAGETLRWRGEQPAAKVDKESDEKMKLMELAFRMGQSAGSGSSSSHVSSSNRPRLPPLAIEDGKVDAEPEASERV